MLSSGIKIKMNIVVYHLRKQSTATEAENHANVFACVRENVISVGEKKNTK